MKINFWGKQPESEVKPSTTEKVVLSGAAVLCLFMFVSCGFITSRFGGGYDSSTATKKVHPLLLHHIIATFLLEKGVPLEQIQKFLGHSKIKTTQIYAESSTEMMKEGFQRTFSNS